ncbi:hypothetical protein CC80DRAFT_523451 [Byssothecium circinans]|uniref:NAD(P)-binding protein n=1 Tax=Byssothecium circinans TaxID=147558 RepID=A0A6A5UBV9_9PLEO|nr:hypothetical protein CC80DRAFT_523451 [Byssothecium circinans]
MQPPVPSPVPTWHNDTYPAINPAAPELSQAGKTVIITGALRDTEALISHDTKVSVFPGSVSDEKLIKHVAESIGTWDVLILNAAINGAVGHIMKSSLEDIWEAYETNTKSIIIAAHAFFPRANKGASVVAVSSAAQAKLVEFLAVENPDLFICSVHPVELPAHFMVWISQPKARFLNGKFVFANWDVEEMSAKPEEWKSSDIATIGLVGWPFGFAG